MSEARKPFREMTLSEARAALGSGCKSVEAEFREWFGDIEWRREQGLHFEYTDEQLVALLEECRRKRNGGPA